MKLTVTTQPEPLVTLEEAKTSLGESGTDRDDLIEGLILAAQAELDGPTGWVGISVAEQSVELRVDRFDDRCCRGIELPYGPVVGVTGITYLDADGAEQTLDGAVFEETTEGRIVLAAGKSWPSTYRQAQAVQIAYDVGIQDTADPRVALMKAAINLHVKMNLDMADPAMYRRAIEGLVQPLRVLAV